MTEQPTLEARDAADSPRALSRSSNATASSAAFSTVIGASAASLVEAHAKGQLRERWDVAVAEARAGGSTDPEGDALAVMLLDQLRTLHRRGLQAIGEAG